MLRQAQHDKVIGKMANFTNELNNLKSKNLYRKRIVTSSLETFPLVELDGKQLINFGSNNYLNLQKIIAESLNYGTGANLVQQASPLITGYTQHHVQLEKALARLKDTQSAMLFSSGFIANLALLTTIAGEKDLILVDKITHASIMEATNYKHLSIRTFPHKNYEYLEKVISKNKAKYENIFIVTDSIFSMEGDKAEFAEIQAIADKYSTYVVVDDAHATGVFGEKGKGLATRIKLKDSNKLIITGSLSKALNSYGGFVAASTEIIDYLVNKAKPYIYNTALPQIHAQSATIAIENIENAQKKLWENVVYFVDLLKAKYKSEYSPIIPIYLCDNAKTLARSQELKAKGFYVPPIRYPTVAPKKAMLRISISAGHSKGNLNDLAQTLLSFT